MSDYIVGLDIGTCFVRAVIGMIVDDGKVEILSVAKQPSQEILREGNIVNIERAKDVIKKVIDEAENKFGYQVRSCVMGIGGRHIDSMSSHGLVAIHSVGKRDRAITQDDINRVLDASNSLPTKPDHEIIALIPKEYKVNGMGGYKQDTVLNNLAVRLEVDVLIITASRTQLGNMERCIENSGYELDNVFLKTIAASAAVMFPDERNLGSILIDLGGGTTDVIVVFDDAPVCTVSIPFGGENVTKDLARVMGMPMDTAEDIKIRHGCCWSELVADNDSEVVIPMFGGRPPKLTTRSELCTVIQSRMSEIFSMVLDEVVQRSRLRQLSGSIILTGGGAQMEGVLELAEYTFNTSSVRIGMPSGLGGIEESYSTPEYATAVGLILADKESVLSAGRAGKSKKKKPSDYQSDFSDSSSEKVKKDSILTRIRKVLF